MALGALSKFTYPSYSDLKKTIGRIDAIAAFSELSVRELLANAGDSDRSEYLLSLAERHHLNLTHVDLGLLPLRTTQLQVVSVNQVFMEFLDAFKGEHPSGPSWEPKDADEAMVKYVWRHALGSNGAATNGERAEFDLVEYYRYVRNRFIHSSEKKQPKLERLRAAVVAHPALRKLDGPNPYREVRFDDIIIFARSALGVADSVCRNSIPTEAEVVSMVRHLDGRQAPGGRSAIRLKDYRKFKNNKARLHQALSTLVQSLYGIDAASSGWIVGELADGLLA